MHWIGCMVCLTYLEIRMPSFFRLLFLSMVALTVFIGMGTLILHLSGDKESSLLAISTLTCVFLTGKMHYQMQRAQQYYNVPVMTKLWA